MDYRTSHPSSSHPTWIRSNESPSGTTLQDRPQPLHTFTSVVQTTPQTIFIFCFVFFGAILKQGAEEDIEMWSSFLTRCRPSPPSPPTRPHNFIECPFRIFQWGAGGEVFFPYPWGSSPTGVFGIKICTLIYLYKKNVFIEDLNSHKTAIFIRRYHLINNLLLKKFRRQTEPNQSM